jgi:hypothetical protein
MRTNPEPTLGTQRTSTFEKEGYKMNEAKHSLNEQRLRAEIDAIRDGLRAIVQKLDQIDKAHRETPAEAKAQLELSPQQLEKLPWKPYREGHRAAWIFADTKGAEKLYELIKESQTGKVPIGEFEYKISKGKDREFISRNPIK